MKKMTEGYKVNWTLKEQALVKLDEDQRDKESKIAYQNVMNELGLEIINS